MSEEHVWLEVCKQPRQDEVGLSALLRGWLDRGWVVRGVQWNTYGVNAIAVWLSRKSRKWWQFWRWFR